MIFVQFPIVRNWSMISIVILLMILIVPLCLIFGIIVSSIVLILYVVIISTPLLRRWAIISMFDVSLIIKTENSSCLVVKFI